MENLDTPVMGRSLIGSQVVGVCALSSFAAPGLGRWVQIQDQDLVKLDRLDTEPPNPLTDLYEWSRP